MDIVWRRLWAPDGRDPAWMSDGVNKRPALRVGLEHLVVHYTGVTSRTYVGQPVVPAAQALFRSVQASKGDEYNYIVGHDGTVLEWAGLNRAAHCSSWNDASIGVLFLLGVGEVPPLNMAAALLDLRRHLVDVGALKPAHRVGQHREYLGTSPGPTWQPKTGGWQTDCPGTTVTARWPMYAAPLPKPEPPAPPQPPVNQEAAVFVSVSDHPRYPGILVVYERLPGGKYIHVNEAEATRLAAWRSGTDVPTWAKSQPKVAWAELAPFVAEA